MRSGWKDRSLKYNLQVLPAEFLWAPSALQITELDHLLHVADPDMEAFTDNLYLLQPSAVDCEFR